MRDLALLLLALESGQSGDASRAAHAVPRVFERLYATLSRRVGVAGADALLARSLVLARREASWLEAVDVSEGAPLGDLGAQAARQSEEALLQGGAALLTQLLGLLVTFVGEALTLRLVADVWPEARWGATRSEPEEAPV